MNKISTIPTPPALGANVHRERRRQQLSLEALAALSGVSKAMLSQIESDKVNPTIGTMWKIAHALNVDFNVLINGKNVSLRKFELSRSPELPQLSDCEKGITFQVLSPVAMAEKFEMYIVEMRGGASHVSQPHVDNSEEYIYLISGRIRVTAGENAAELSAGDFLLYQSDVTHSLENIGEEAARIHMTVRFN